MKTLFLLRHAKSDWADPNQSDFDRPLNPRGREAARAMGRELRRLGLAADRILVSPAERVVETLALVAEGYGGRMPLAYEERLYLASAETLLAIVRSAGDDDRRLLLVGHNPGLYELGVRLSDDGGAAVGLAEKMPTGALVELAFKAECWPEIAPGTGRIERFLRPRDLA